MLHKTPTPDTASQAQVAVSKRRVVENLRALPEQVDHLALPTGPLGRDFLDALEVLDQTRLKIRAKARELLLRDPGAIPNWTAVQGGTVRELSKDALAVFAAMAKSDARLIVSLRRSTRSESIRTRDDDRILSWVQCARCRWSDRTNLQFEFEFNERPSYETRSV
jgi:hypothetical protein